MRVQNIKVKITIPVPINKPDKNGTIFTKEAIESAVSNFHTALPIIYMDNDKYTDGMVVGVTTDTVPVVDWDGDSQTCNMTIDGVLFYGGAGIRANEIKDGKVTDFEFASIGLTI